MILYTRDQCPACVTVKLMLANDPSLPHVPEHNIDQNAGYLANAQRSGITAVPTLYVDGQLFPGTAAIMAELRRRAGGRR